ncbi:DsbA family protein [Conexibacter woesei]|uniref:DsbA family protein n=1 Tax=Conexibacter woesei TaxID=191495 RepID=UPI0004076880|nr:DsbA family protein [Conexibacter woesei]
MGGLEVTQHGGDGDEDAGAPPEPERAAFYFDFASPVAYLAAERVLATLPFAAEWIPIRAPRAWDDGFRCAAEREAAQEDVVRVAGARSLQAVRWPPEGFASETALRAATYAKSIGRVVAFSLAAFRQAYAGGADLSDTDMVLIAASACEMHPRAVLQALERAAVERELTAATALAVARGVTEVPTVWIPDGRLLEGDAALDSVTAP